ncbi:MAG: hypothetical protein AABZ39_07015 [Spirochaetota bacterium]
MKHLIISIILTGAVLLHGQSVDELLSRDDGKDKFLSLARHYMQKKQYNRAISYYERYFTNGGTSAISRRVPFSLKPDMTSWEPSRFLSIG